MQYQYRTIKSPVGDVHLIGDGEVVHFISFRKSDMGKSIKGNFVRNPKVYPLAVRELDAYFKGKLIEFTFPFNLVMAGFREKVLRQLTRVRYGDTVSYKELARRAGSAGASRAAGGACANNPLPIVIPCHRVLRSDGTIGGWSGLPGVKEELLALERKHSTRK